MRTGCNILFYFNSRCDFPFSFVPILSVRSHTTLNFAVFLAISFSLKFDYPCDRIFFKYFLFYLKIIFQFIRPRFRDEKQTNFKINFEIYFTLLAKLRTSESLVTFSIVNFPTSSVLTITFSCQHRQPSVLLYLFCSLFCWSFVCKSCSYALSMPSG